MELRTVTLSLQGKARNNNEDSYFADASQSLLMVADGMGGHQAGEVASSMAVNSILESISVAIKNNQDQDLAPEEVLREAFYYANNKIFSYSSQNAELKNMGSTLTVAWLVKGQLYIGHVGDSRAYFFGRGAEQLTVDHSVAGELLREGGITKAEAEEHPKKHMLTRALGVEQLVEVDVYHYQWQANDVLLLCTDGLSNLLDLEEILPKIDVSKDKTEILAALVTMAEEAGSLDDITGVLAWQKSLDAGNSHEGEVSAK